MDKVLPANTHTKVFYRPLEAAIRWTGLLRYEARILRMLHEHDALPDNTDLPRWPQLRLNLERLHDALVNGDLPYGKNGITCDDPSLLDSPDLTVRHVDLKVWMIRCYPDQRPSFLFDAFERHLHPAISVEAVQALLMDREALRVQLADRLKAWDALQEEYQALSAAHATAEKQGSTLGARSESTYLNIVGGLLTLLLGKSPGGVPYSSFETLESVINALVAHYGDRSGISERTLWSKFAAAKRHLQSQDI
ncbi:hypothetical protein [Pseudomonas aeruginosa]|uniref:hypothetical protein n=1 Tax=Pseudomonas aeruginosa TaxID=287 RepID=UPI0003BB2EAE|nr:hypothetical protein [Pseudomonas aeruginosa]ERY96141.1 hypothetical protein Q022_04425 [Pseudomonas aeruginosa BWHPSA009]